MSDLSQIRPTRRVSVREVFGIDSDLVVPAFAVGRTQSVVLFLGQLMRDGALPKLPVYVDSPMSREATRIMRKHPELFDAETRARLRSIDTQMLRLLEEVAAGRQEALGDLRADLAQLTRAVRALGGRGDSLPPTDGRG